MKKGSEASKPADSLVMAVSVQQKSRFNPALLTHVPHLRTRTTYQSVFFLHVTSCGDRNGNLPESGSRWFFADKEDGQIDGRRGAVHFHP
jgi:hypothetical protein